MLETKSLSQLRGIAQSFGIGDIFSKTDSQLRQEIGLKQQSLAPSPRPDPVVMPYDSRMMTKPPSRICTQESLKELLANHTAKGMHLLFPTPEEWQIKYGKREDTGTMRQPLRNVLECANRLMRDK